MHADISGISRKSACCMCGLLDSMGGSRVIVDYNTEVFKVYPFGSLPEVEVSFRS